MLAMTRDVGGFRRFTPWDDDDDLGFDDEPISEPLSEVCGGVTTWDFQAGSALGNTSTAEIDYRTLTPKKLTDPNLNSAEAITDPLGMVIATSVYSFKGQPLESQKQVLSDYKAEVDWPDTGKETLLETEVFNSSTQYDAIGRVNIITSREPAHILPNCSP